MASGTSPGDNIDQEVSSLALRGPQLDLDPANLRVLALNLESSQKGIIGQLISDSIDLANVILDFYNVDILHTLNEERVHRKLRIHK